MCVGTGTRLQAIKLPANSDQEIVFSSKLENLQLKTSSWQTAIDDEPITFEGIKTHHNVLKGDIHSLYQEALYARVTNKLSYDIIGLVALIDSVKQAADRYLRNEQRIANAERSSNTVTNDINERVSELGPVPSDNDSLLAHK